MIKALAFDFDGLILDTEGPIFKSWQELFQSYGARLTLEEWQIGLGSAEGTRTFYATLDERLGEPVDLDAITPERLARELDLIAQEPILPGVMDYLQEARRRGLRTTLSEPVSNGSGSACRSTSPASSARTTSPVPSPTLGCSSKWSIASASLHSKPSPSKTPPTACCPPKGPACTAWPSPTRSPASWTWARLTCCSTPWLTSPWGN